MIMSWFRLGFRGLSPYFFGILFHHPFLGFARVLGCVPTLLASCSIIISWFRLGFRGLCPYCSGTLFCHPCLVPARVSGPVAKTAVELNGFLNPSKKQLCSTMIFCSGYSGILFSMFEASDAESVQGLQISCYGHVTLRGSFRVAITGVRMPRRNFFLAGAIFLKHPLKNAKTYCKPSVWSTCHF